MSPAPNIGIDQLREASTDDQIGEYRMTDSARPVGSVLEIVNEGLDPEKLVACAAAKKGNQPTCPFAGICRMPFRPLQSGAQPANEPVPGPQFIGGVKRLPNGDQNGFVMECWRYYESGLATEYEAAPRTGVQIRITAREGEHVSQKYSERLHQEQVKNCGGCLKGECTLRKSGKRQVQVPFHARPNESLRDMVEDQRIQNQIRQNLHFDHQSRSIEQGPTIPIDMPPAPQAQKGSDGEVPPRARRA